MRKSNFFNDIEVHENEDEIKVKKNNTSTTCKKQTKNVIDEITVTDNNPYSEEIKDITDEIVVDNYTYEKEEETVTVDEDCNTADNNEIRTNIDTYKEEHIIEEKEELVTNEEVVKPQSTLHVRPKVQKHSNTNNPSPPKKKRSKYNVATEEYIIPDLTYEDEDDSSLNITMCFGLINRNMPNKFVVNGKGIALERHPLTNKVLRVNTLLAKTSPIRKTEEVELEYNNLGTKNIAFVNLCEYKTGKKENRFRRRVCKEFAMYISNHIVFCMVEDFGKCLELKVFAAYDIDRNSVSTVTPTTKPMLRSLAGQCKKILAQFNKKPFNQCELLGDKEQSLNKEKKQVVKNNTHTPRQQRPIIKKTSNKRQHVSSKVKSTVPTYK